MKKTAEQSRPTPLFDLQEAKRYLPNANRTELADFARRQTAARRRLARLVKFYANHHCRLARLHLLAAAAIALGRFCGVSETFDRIGESLMPIDDDFRPASAKWLEYAAACRRELPLEVREELWLAAHFEDIERVRALRLEELFYAEAATRRDEPVWLLLRQHLEVTLGVRMLDRSAIEGLVPHETAIAESLALTVKKLSTACWRLVARYAAEAARAVCDFSAGEKGLLSYRQTAFEMMRCFLLAASVSSVFRRGLRERERGRRAEAERWMLLEEVLRDKVDGVDPLIREFYGNPSRFEVAATLRLETLPAKIWSRALTLLLGQGLFETDLREIPARFRIFKRRDGSMHFIRELYCRGKYRVFDSDFLIRDGRLYEVFNDLRAAVELAVEPAADQSLAISSRRFLFCGRRVPSLGLAVEFTSRVEAGAIEIDGQLQMKPRTAFGRFLAHKILRRPRRLGSIHYTARRKDV